jgi:hypothetical protein
MFATEINEKTLTNTLTTTTTGQGSHVESIMKKFTPRNSTLSSKIQA